MELGKASLETFDSEAVKHAVAPHNVWMQPVASESLPFKRGKAVMVENTVRVKIFTTVSILKGRCQKHTEGRVCQKMKWVGDGSISTNFWGVGEKGTSLPRIEGSINQHCWHFEGLKNFVFFDHFFCGGVY